MKTEQIKSLIIVVLILLLAFTGYWGYNQLLSKEEQKNLNNVLASELQTWKDKEGLARAKNDVFETERAETFLQLKTQDSSIRELQAVVKEFNKQFKELRSAVLMTSKTQIDTMFVPINTGISIDSTRGKIQTEFKNEWIEASYGFDLTYKPESRSYIADSTYLKLGITNRYSVVLGYEKEGFLGMFKGKPVAEVKNYNPYTETTELKAYQTKGDTYKPWGIGLSGGVTYIDKIRPYIGFGINYTVFRF